jgi:splicing factor 3B subunit 3
LLAPALQNIFAPRNRRLGSTHGLTANMANIQTTQTFYALTLEAGSAPTSAVTCNVIPGLKSTDQQIFEARGERLYLHRVVENEERTEVKLSTLLEHDAFGTIRGLSAFRVPATTTDSLIVVSDSGRIAMLQYDPKKNTFERIQQETFGKSGVRRMVPGQYLASDSKGRCSMIASAEKNKVVYIYQRSQDGTITVSSPHEANMWATLCFGICALDTGWEHPIFASLELDYSDAESDPSGAAYEAREKMLVYYTVDLGLNHVVKSWSDAVDYTSNMMFAVPGGQDGPSGLLVCAEGRIYYRHNESSPLSIPIPRREGATEDPSRKRIIVAGCPYLNRSRRNFWFLLQTEDGDVFKLSMEMEVDGQGRQTNQPARLHLKYYETLPVARQLILIKKGYLYVAAENGNAMLYHVNDLAENLDFEPHNNFTSDDVSPDPADDYTPTYFRPRGLAFLSVAQQIASLHPLIRTKVDNLTDEDAPQIYAVQGTGPKSVFKTMRHGFEVNQIISSAIGQMQHDKLWTLKEREADEHHSLLLLNSSYADRTTVLSIGDDVETLEDTLFMTNRATILAAQMGEDTLVQVHGRGVRSIFAEGKLEEWNAPPHTTIVAASANRNQLLLGLSTSELVFFFMDVDGHLNQLEEMPEMTGKIMSLSVAPTPKGGMQAKFAAVGCDDQTIRILSIDLDTPLENRSVQLLSGGPTSVEVMAMTDPQSGISQTYVHIGLDRGVYLRALMDDVTGDLSEVRTKLLGTRPVRLYPAHVSGLDIIVACSSRPWLAYNHPHTGLFTHTPLITDPMEGVATFVTEPLKGLCAIQREELVIFDLPRMDGRLTSEEVSLRYTPRSMARNPEFPVFYVAQSEGNTLSPATKDAMLGIEADKNGMEIDGANGAASHSAPPPKEIPATSVDPDKLALEQHLGLSKGTGHWASCVQAIDPVTLKSVTSTWEMTDNEAALCCTTVAFASKEWETFLAVGTGQHMNPGGISPSTGVEPKGFVHIYKILDEGRTLKFLHKTAVDMPVYAMTPIHGRLAVGIGNEVFIYDLGMKHILRKARATVVPNMIISLETMGNRIICGDVSESVTYVVYKPQYSRMIPFVDDVVQRWTTATTMLDYETVAGGDKFGNIWVVRCPEQASKEADDEGVGGYIPNERSYLNGAPYRLELRAHFFTQDIPTSLQRTSLVSGGQELLFWSGLQGTLGIMVPFVSREDVVLFTSLEQLIRQKEPPLSGRDHLMYRSYYVPVKGVIDGDLCERFMLLPENAKREIAAETDREVKEIEKKVQEIRMRVAF